MMTQFHPKASEIKKILDNYGINNLYHFTAVDNLSIIAECGGLWSKQKLEQAQLLDKIITGGNELSHNLDKRLGNWDKVHIYFCPNTPMAYRVQQYSEGRNPQSSHICYFILDPSVALWNGVFFTDTNATKITDGHQREQGLLGLKLVDFETIMAHLSGNRMPKQRWHRNVQAECLVPDQIPLKYVKGVSFISEASLKEGQRLWGKIIPPPFKVEKDLFSIGFALVNDFKLTSKNITKENVGTLQLQDERIFSKNLCPKITLLTNLYVTACSRAKIVWLDNEGNVIGEDKTDFEKVSTYWHWPSLQIANLDEGNYSVEYYLNEIRWFKAHFTVGS